MSKSIPQKRQSSEKDLVRILVEANIVTRKLHDLLDQTNIAKAAGMSRQAIQKKAKNLEEGK